jgi:hypothetical protein
MLEVLGSNIDQITEYHCQGSLWLFSVSPGVWWDITNKYAAAISFQFLT